MSSSSIPTENSGQQLCVVDLDRVATIVSQSLAAPIVLLSEVSSQRQEVWSQAGLGAPWPTDSIPLSHSLCQRVVAEEAPVAIENAPEDPELSRHPAVQEYGVVAYLGVPIQRPGAEVPAVLSVIDTSPRVWTEEERLILTSFAALVEEALASRDGAPDEHSMRVGYRALFEASPDALMVLDPDSGVISDANPAACDLYCMTHENIVGAQLDDIARPARGHESLLKRVRAGEGSFHMATVHQCSDGREVEVEVRLQTIEGQGHRVALSVTRDETERNRIQDQLRVNEAQFRQLAESLPQMVWTTDSRGRKEFLNERWHAYTGIPAEQSDDVWDRIVHPDDYEPSVERWNDSLTTGAPFEIEYRLKRAEDGSYRWFVGRAEPVRDLQGRIVQWFGTFTDIHELREARRKLRASTERLRLVHRATTDVVWDWDAASGTVEWSPAVRDVLGWNVQRTHLAWGQTRIHPDDRDRVVESFSAAIQKGGPTWQGEYRFQRADGSYVFVLDRGHIERDANGVATRIVGALLDISERKEIESQLILARETAEAAERLKSALLDNMSHEFRTPISAILGCSELLQEEVRPNLRAFTNAIRSGGQRLLDTSTTIIEFAQIEGGKLDTTLETVDLYTLAQTACENLRPTAESSGLTLEVNGSAALATTDRNCVARSLHHIIGNAVKFTTSGGVTVEVGADAQGPMIRVVDTGIGIDASFMSALFNPFTQESEGLHRTHEGSGLGLAVALRLMRLADGDLKVDSDQGEGTTVTLRFRPPATES